MRILVVEDDVDIQDILKRMLLKIDPHVTIETARNAEETISLMSSQAWNSKFGYDLIISDITLDGPATGYDLWKFCSAQFPKTYFVFISGISAAEFLNHVKDDSKFPPFLRKPFVMNELKSVMDNAYNRNSRLR